MLAIGVLLLGLAVCSVLILRGVFTGLDAPRWTRLDLVGELVAVAVTALFGFGVMATGIGLIDLARGTGSLLHEAVPAVLALVIAAAAIRFVQHHPPAPVTVRPAH